MIIDTKRTFDVAVIGSGMSGAVLSIILAKFGVDVVMLESGTHPRFAVGESTIPHTSLLSSLAAERYGVPELETISHPEHIAREVCSSCGIKRSFGFAYHRPGAAHDPREGLQFGTSSKDENHLYRQDVDAWLTYAAVRRGVVLRQSTTVESVAIDAAGVRLTTSTGEQIAARFVVDGSGFRSVLASQFGLRESPPRFEHHSRSLFTHMIDVGRFEPNTPMSIGWDLSTLHHVFEGGWFWVIPFNNRCESTNPLVSVGLTVDPRVHPRSGDSPEREFQSFLDRFPDVADQFASATAVRPWIATDRLQYSSRETIGYRWCLMSHAAGAVDPLFSRGLINTLEVTVALIDPLLEALAEDDFSLPRFAHIERLQQRVLDYNDRLVSNAFSSWADFDLCNAWLRVWAVGTILAEFRLMNALSDYTATRDERFWHGEVEDPCFSAFEDPDYRVFFDRAVDLMGDFRAGRSSAGATASLIFELIADYEFRVTLSRDGMRRAGWLGDEVLSDRNVEFARSGYRWAIGNPDTRDLFGCSDTFYRWRARRSDPHLA